MKESFFVMKRWMENRNQNKYIADYFNRYGYSKIGIYGAGDVGRLTYLELKDTNVKIVFFVDRNGEGLIDIDSIPVISVMNLIEDHCDKIDALLVTPLGNYGSICRLLSKNIPELPVLSLKDVVNEL